MKKIKFIAIVAIALAFLGMTSKVSALDIDPYWPSQWTGADNSNLNANQIASIVGYTGPEALVELYKAEVSGRLEGQLAFSYQTSFYSSPTEPSDAVIRHVSGSFITGSPIYLYVKDGNNVPAYYIFNISQWDGTETINLSGFWTGRGSISHVALLGTTTSVPEPGTMILLGLSLIGLAVGTRKLKN